MNTRLHKTVFKIPKMDCPSEEGIIRLALDHAPGIRGMIFDLPNRSLTITHEQDAHQVLELLVPLNFGASIEHTCETTEESASQPDSSSMASEQKILKILLAINAIMFVFEICLGLMAQSLGLIADSLDMFSDAAVYGVGLYAVGRSSEIKRKSARASGYIQLILAVSMFVEAARLLIWGSEPMGSVMMIVAIVALIANLVCMALLFNFRGGGVHMRASWIFSSNDVIANLGVICAGFLVQVYSSHIPDLLIGTLIGLVVLSGAFRILKISKKTPSMASARRF